MKEYIKPDVQHIDFTSEAIATGAIGGETGTTSFVQDPDPFG